MLVPVTTNHAQAGRPSVVPNATPCKLHPPQEQPRPVRRAEVSAGRVVPRARTARSHVAQNRCPLALPLRPPARHTSSRVYSSILQRRDHSKSTGGNKRRRGSHLERSVFTSVKAARGKDGRVTPALPAHQGPTLGVTQWPGLFGCHLLGKGVGTFAMNNPNKQFTLASGCRLTQRLLSSEVE